MRLSSRLQVLSNPELRERYDKHGEQALDVDFMDSAEFFTMLFGSDRCCTSSVTECQCLSMDSVPGRPGLGDHFHF